MELIYQGIFFWELWRCFINFRSNTEWSCSFINTSFASLIGWLSIPLITMVTTYRHGQQIILQNSMKRCWCLLSDLIHNFIRYYEEQPKVSSWCDKNLKLFTLRLSTFSNYIWEVIMYWYFMAWCVMFVKEVEWKIMIN